MKTSVWRQALSKEAQPDIYAITDVQAMMALSRQIQDELNDVWRRGVLDEHEEFVFSRWFHGIRRFHQLYPDTHGDGNYRDGKPGF